MCYPQGEFIIGDRDVQLGDIGGAPFYIGRAQYEVWRHTQLIIDVVPGRGGMFSLDNGRERRFLTRSTVCAVKGADSAVEGPGADVRLSRRQTSRTEIGLRNIVELCERESYRHD